MCFFFMFFVKTMYLLETSSGVMKKYLQHYIVILWYYIAIFSVSMFHFVVRIYKRGCMCIGVVFELLFIFRA